ncbi:MAG: CocE/NonD family hydrolase, partial [Alphaproteobacteria bacterium]
EWAGTQDWSNGKVGLNGISYYGMNQWQVASLQPRHLAAMCVWEGAADFYRDMGHHGGIASRFAETWYREAIVPRQHGVGAKGYRSRINGEWISGPDTLTEDELADNRTNYGADILAHPLIDE